MPGSPQPLKPAGPRLYDVSIDDYRAATQLDVDQLVEISQCYGRLRKLVADTHADLLTRLEAAKAKHRAPHGGRTVTFEGLE